MTNLSCFIRIETLRLLQKKWYYFTQFIYAKLLKVKLLKSQHFEQGYC